MASITELEVTVENNRKTLESKTIKELIKEYATPLQIVGRHDMKKAELIQAILMKYAETEPQKFIDGAATKEEVETQEPVEKENKKEKGTELTDVQLQNKAKYVENAEMGTIVAFKLPGMKVKSAKLIRRSTKNMKFKVETAYGTEFIISYDDVIWVKTNKRWPKGVYNLLKGIGDE